jgi:hypothetical protein
MNQLSMFRAPLFRLPAICLIIVISAGAPAAATFIGFDDIDASAGNVILDTLSPYQGLNWTDFTVYTNTPGFPGFNNGIVSSPNAAFTTGDSNGSPITSTITASSPFNFVSAYLGAGWLDGLSVTVNGLDKGVPEFSQTVTVSTTGAELFNFNYTGIDEVDIFSTITGSTTDPFSCGFVGCTQVTLDDLTFAPASGPPPSTVPEPAMVSLTGLGMLILAVFHRRKAIQRRP